MILDRLKRKFNEVMEEDKQQHNSTPSPNSKGHSLAGKLMSKAGNLLKFDYSDILKQSQQIASIKNPQSHMEKLDEEILEVLIEENRQMKTILAQTTQDLEELRERAETLKSLEEEASEENEMLKFKVLSLESQAQMEGRDMSQMTIVDEMRHSKKALQKEVEQLQKEIKALTQINGQEGSDDIQINDDPKQSLDQLRMLYESHKVEFSDQDQIRVMVSLLLRDQKLYKFYRERLFQKVAKKAIDSAELLYKTSGQSTPNMVGQQSKVYADNKKLKRENEQLKQNIYQQTQQVIMIQEQLQQQERKNQQKVLQLKSQVNKIGSFFAQLKQDYSYIKNDTEEQQDFFQQFLQPNLQLLQTKVNQYSQLQVSQLAQSRKAVFAKNKEISDLSNKIRESQSHDNQQNSKLIFEKNKKIDDLFHQNQQLQQELEEQREFTQSSQQQIQMFRDKLRSNEGGSDQRVRELQAKNQQLLDEIDKLKQEAKEAKHNEVIKSLMKTDVNKEVDEARKAVLEKNKIISNMNNKQFELMRTIEERDDEINELRMNSRSSSNFNNSGGGSSQELQRQNQQLLQENEKLKHEIKEAKHNEVIKSLIKTDVNKEVDDARKAVIEKNKIISDMNNKQYELIRTIEARDEEINQLRQQNNPRQQSNQKQSFESSIKTKPQEEEDFFGGFLTTIGRSIFGNSEAPKQQQETIKPSKQQWEKQNSPKQQQWQSQNSPIVNETKGGNKQPVFSISEEKPKRVDSPSFFKKDNKVMMNFVPDKEDILEMVKEQSEILNSDSPQKILELQIKESTPKRSNTLSQSMQAYEEKHSQAQVFSFKNEADALAKSHTNTHLSSKQQTDDDDDDFFSAFKKINPNKNEEELKLPDPIIPPQPEVNLDFLNDMFGTLLGKTSPDKKKEETKESLNNQIHDKVGWADDLDIDIDTQTIEKEPEFEEVPTQIHLPEDQQIQMTDIERDLTESPRFTQEEQAQRNEIVGGWAADEEDIIIDDDITMAQKQNQQQQQESPLFNQNQEGWNEDVQIEDELLQASSSPPKDQEQQQQQQQPPSEDIQHLSIQRMFTFSEMNKDLVESVDMSYHKSKSAQVILTSIREEDKTGWADDDDILVDDILEASRESQEEEKTDQQQYQQEQKAQIEEINTESAPSVNEGDELNNSATWQTTSNHQKSQQHQQEQEIQNDDDLFMQDHQQPVHDDPSNLQRMFTFSEMNPNLLESSDIPDLKSKSQVVLLSTINEEEKQGWFQEEEDDIRFDELEIPQRAQVLAVSQQPDDMHRVFTFSELQMTDQLSQFKLLAQSKEDLDVVYEQNFSSDKPQAPTSGWGTGTLDIIEDDEFQVEQEMSGSQQRLDSQQRENEQQIDMVDELEDRQSNDQQVVMDIEEDKEQEIPEDEKIQEHNIENQEQTPSNNQYQEDQNLNEYGYEEEYQDEIADNIQSSPIDDDQQSQQPPLSEPVNYNTRDFNQDPTISPKDDKQSPSSTQLSPQSQRLPEIQHLQEPKQAHFSIMTQHMTEAQQDTNFAGWGDDLQPSQFDERGDLIEEQQQENKKNQEIEIRQEEEEKVERIDTKEGGWSDQMPDIEFDFDQQEPIQERGGTFEEMGVEGDKEEKKEEQQNQVLASGWDADDDILDI